MSNGNLTDVLTPAIVGRCVEAEALQAPVYRDALALLRPYSGRYRDADEVASLARVLLADCLASTGGPSLAAGSAVSRSAAWHAARWHRSSAETTVGDTGAPGAEDLLPSAVGGDPADRYRWTTRDTLAELAALQPTDSARDALALLAVLPDGWTGTGRPNVAALARAMGITTGKGRQAVGQSATLALQTARDCLSGVLTGADVPSSSAGKGGTDRDHTVPTSGPASPVVLTDRHAGRWLTLADRSVRVTDQGAREVLQSVCTPAVRDHYGYPLALGYGQPERPTMGLPAYIGGTAKEVDRPDPAASAPTHRTAGRPAGVGIGMRHGWSGVAGDCAPLPRPAAPSTRKRDGGIGASMVTGATGYGRDGTGTNPLPGAAVEPCRCDDVDDVTGQPVASRCGRHDVTLRDTAPAGPVNTLPSMASLWSTTPATPVVPVRDRSRVALAVLTAWHRSAV